MTIQTRYPSSLPSTSFLGACSLPPTPLPTSSSGTTCTAPTSPPRPTQLTSSCSRTSSRCSRQRCGAAPSSVSGGQAADTDHPSTYSQVERLSGLVQACSSAIKDGTSGSSSDPEVSEKHI